MPVSGVLAALKQHGLSDKTLVVFTSDNGGSLSHAQNNDPWRWRESHYDGGLRVPFLARCRDESNRGPADCVALNFDLFPTFLELAGVPLAKDLDAVSLTPAPGTISAAETGFVFYPQRGGTGLRRQQL
ncbi:MAG: sulfatase-like hydrolase/transferase [Planctomycetaceae bacterium]